MLLRALFPAMFVDAFANLYTRDIEAGVRFYRWIRLRWPTHGEGRQQVLDRL